MARPANQASSSGDTNKPKRPKVKSPGKTKTGGASAGGQGLYDWGDGKGKIHTVSKDVHQMHVEDPLTRDPLYASAKQQATAFYAPQSNALDTTIRNAPGYYQQYIAGNKTGATASANYAQPIITNARTFATNINAAAPGLDPSSPEYQRSQQAGKGLSALAEFGVQNLEANQAADQTYFAGQRANAQAALPGVMADLQQRKGQLGSQIAGKTQELYQGLKQAAVNEDIARQTLGLNVSKAAGLNPITGEPLPPEPASPSDQKTQAELDYFNKHGYWPPTGPPKPKSTGKTQEEKDAAKHAKAIQTATGKAKVKVKDIQDAWARGGTVTEEVDDPDQPPNLLTGQRPKKKVQRKMTREELRRALGDKYGSTWVSIMEYVRAGTPLTQAQIDYLHSTDPDLRIPKEWVRGRAKPKPQRKPTSRPGNAPAPGGSRPT